MTNKGQTNSEELKIQGLLDRYLHFRSSKVIAAETHLDEDSLNAFVEGKLTQRELSPVIKHLIDCTFCLNVTAELSRLELAFADENNLISSAAAAAPEPSRISDVLQGLLSRIFGTQDNAVFAHHETEEEEEEKEVKAEGKKEV
jgi:hypothetical protein